MPSLDGGHYFFTALLPIDNRGIVEHGAFKSSPVHMVRDALEALPTALQTRAAEEIGIQSPFARSLRTHFVRIFVIDAPYFNGRDPADSIQSAVRATDLLAAQPNDKLACPYLAFIGDFDPMAGADEPRAWLEELWTLAKPELCSIFEYCYGFSAQHDAAAFASFVLRGQVETTMPFNDYWTIPPPLPSLRLWTLALPPVLAALAGGAIAIMGGWPWWAGLALAVLLGAAGVVVDYALVTERGAKPFPAAPNATLRHVLKALYLQQAFAQFALTNQGAAPAQLRAAFAAFVAATRPDDLDGPTQPPGVVRSRFGPEAADA
ncbi:MAG TPA: hypothetical protein VFE13_07590 [Caulobacteraceae bacterium]|jgi:hypothetical protein|nr:hypothetical protein [Caulobacteraceae bacterium]